MFGCDRYIDGGVPFWAHLVTRVQWSPQYNQSAGKLGYGNVGIRVKYYRHKLFLHIVETDIFFRPMSGKRHLFDFM